MFSFEGHLWRETLSDTKSTTKLNWKFTWILLIMFSSDFVPVFLMIINYHEQWQMVSFHLFSSVFRISHTQPSKFHRNKCKPVHCTMNTIRKTFYCSWKINNSLELTHLILSTGKRTAGVFIDKHSIELLYILCCAIILNIHILLQPRID